MHPFIHLHVHSQYSILDGQASIQALVDKAMRDGMRGIANRSRQHVWYQRIL